MTVSLQLDHVGKSFTLYLQNGVQLPVLHDVSFSLAPGDCTVLDGPSGIGKSSILRMIYGNYGIDRGRILVRHRGEMVDIAEADARQMMDIRQLTIAYVSQFLRAIPRLSALEVAAEPLLARGKDADVARREISDLFARLNLPERLWSLPPSTFSGGEQQRVNIARGFATDHPVLLLDEPTASLDSRNRDVVIDLIKARKAQGTTILGIFHDPDVRHKVATVEIDVSRFAPHSTAA